MADTADQIQYRQEFVAGFEQQVSYFRATGTTEVVIKGNQATFLIADTGGAEAVTRGRNGMIPTRADNLTQTTATLKEWHDKTRKTDFNIFASQGDQRRIMQLGGIKVINRKIDDLMINELSTTTLNTGASGVTASVEVISKAIGLLSLNEVEVEDEDNMFFAISPAARTYLMRTKEWTNGQYVDIKMLNGAVKRMWRWMGLNTFVTNRLVGRTTSAEKMIMYHRSSIGWASDGDNLDVQADENKEEKYFWARTSGVFAAKLLQGNGACLVTHDGSAINPG